MGVSKPSVDADALILKLLVFVQAKPDRSGEGLLDVVTGLYNVRGLPAGQAKLAPTPHVATLLGVFAIRANDIDVSESDELDPRAAEQLSDVCRRTARSSDAVGRLGRSEFAIIAPETDDQGAIRQIERLRGVVESSAFPAGDRTIRFKVRAGYCAVADFATSSVDAVELLLRASSALRHVRTSEAPREITAFEDVPVRFVR